MGKEKVRAVEVRYLGFLQGYKVYVNGEKYPKQHGHWFTTLDKNQAIKSGLKAARRKK